MARRSGVRWCLVALVLALTPLPAEAGGWWRGGDSVRWGRYLWEAVADFLKLGPDIDPDGVTRDEIPNLGPDIDPNGVKGDETPDLGPDMDPNGRD